MTAKPALSIQYCTVCNFRGRALWLAQELLADLEGQLARIDLVPGRGGVFDVRLAGELVFSQKREGRFPEPAELKALVRAKLGLEPKRRHRSKST